MYMLQPENTDYPWCCQDAFADWADRNHMSVKEAFLYIEQTMPTVFTDWNLIAGRKEHLLLMVWDKLYRRCIV